MRTLRYLFAAVAVAWAVHGCSTEENSFRQVPENELTTSQQVARARAFFEEAWSPPPATRAASQSTIQALIAGRGIVPDWQHSLFSENSTESYLEFPLITDEQIGFGEPGNIRVAQQRLVIREIKASGDLYAYTSLWIPDDDESAAVMPGFSMFDKGSFSGEILFFHLDGTFYWGAEFEDGVPTAEVFIHENGEEPPITRTDCDFISEPIYGKYVVGGLDENWHIVAYKTFIECNSGISGGGGGGSSGGGGGGGSIGVGGGPAGTPPPPTSPDKPDEEPEDPCASMATKMDSDDFTEALDVLAGGTSDNREYGMGYRYNNGAYDSFDYEEGAVGVPELSYSPSASNPIDGYFHTHYDGTLPVFSVSDLLAPGGWNARGGIDNMGSFSLGVITPDGTYFLQITDPTAYQRFFNTYGQDELTMKVLENWYKDTYLITETTSTAAAVNGLARMLNALNSGMTLMKKSGDSFNRVTVGANNSVTENPC